MLLLLTLLAHDGGAVLRILARAKQLSLNELARRSSVNKSNLIRFINSADGGYLSETARRQILFSLDWTDAGPNPDVVHQLLLSDGADASYLLRVVFEGKARLGLLGRGPASGELVFAGDTGDACLLLRCASTNVGVLDAIQSSSQILPGFAVETQHLPATIGNLLGSPRYFRRFLAGAKSDQSSPVPEAIFNSVDVCRFFAAGHTLRELDDLISQWLEKRRINY